MGLRAKRELHWQEIGGGSVGTFPIASIMEMTHPGVKFLNAKNQIKRVFLSTRRSKAQHSPAKMIDSRLCTGNESFFTNRIPDPRLQVQFSL